MVVGRSQGPRASYFEQPSFPGRHRVAQQQGATPTQQARPTSTAGRLQQGHNLFDRFGGGTSSLAGAGSWGGARRASGGSSLRALQMGGNGGMLNFDTAPRPESQASKLKPGQHTGFHSIREENGRFLLDTSDAVRLPVGPDKLKEMVEGGNWTQDWWGGNSTTERNPPGPGEVANFDFVPDTAESQLPGFLKKAMPGIIKDTPLAKLNISIKEPEVRDLGGGRSVTTYRAKLNPAGNNPGDDAGKITDTGDISGDMRIHVVDNGDGTSTFQLDWNGMEVEPKGPGGTLEPFDASVKSEGFGSGITNKLKKSFIDVVGTGHNDTLRPSEGFDSGFARMAEKLGVADAYQHEAVSFKDAHPNIARRNNL